MRTVPFPLVGGSYADETKPWSMQDTVNYLPTMAERDGTRAPVMLKTPPGLRPYLEIPGTGGGETPLVPSKPVRGTYEAEGKFFAVIGTTLYRISNTGIAIPLGSVPGLGRVTFAHNQIPLGNEVVVMNGSAGYCYNTVADTFTRITDPGFPGSAVAGFIDGMILGIEPQGRYAFNSRPAAATDYNTLDRFTSEVSPDRLVTLGVVGNDLLLLSTSTGEFFEDQGHSEQPFRSKRISFDIGCAGPYAITALDNNLAWLGSDGFFYRLENGYGKKRISTRSIEQAIRGLDWWQAFAFNWKDSGYDIAYFTFPDGRTWGFDAANGWEPARRESYELMRWRVNSMTRWNDEWYAGDFQTGRIWKLDWNYVLEGDKEFISERTCAVMHDNQNLVRAPRLELVMDTGQSETVPAEFPAQPTGPSITGSAPDGLEGEAYSFQYTVTPGDAPIVRTELRGVTLPEGWVWNQSTATISNPTPTDVRINLSMRTIDANGLWADHEDEFYIVQEVLLLITGSAPLSGQPMFVRATAIEPLVFEGIPQSSGANLVNSIPAYFDGTWCAAGSGETRYSLDGTETWLTGTTTIPSDETPYHLVGGPSGWLLSNSEDFLQATKSDDPPDEFTNFAYNIVRGEETFPVYDNSSFSMCRYTGDTYYAAPANYPGFLIRNETLVGDWQGLFKRGDDGPVNGDTISAFYDICEHGGALYATVNYRPLSNQRTQLRRSTDGGLTFPTVLIDVARGALNAPWQLESSGDVLLVYAWGGRYVWTSADNFSTPVETGLATTRTSGLESETRGRQIVWSGSRFYLISGDAPGGDEGKGNLCVWTDDGTVVSEPVAIPVANSMGIASGTAT